MSSRESIAALSAELGVDLSDALSPMDDAAVERLRERVREAKVRELSQLDASIGTGLEIVPRMLRGPVKKILFGGER